MVKFERESIQELSTPGEEVTLVLSGLINQDRLPIDFKGNDTIRVVNR